MDLFRLTAHEIQELVVAKETSPTEVVHAIFDRIEDRDGQVGAYLYLDRESALNEAQALEARLAAGDHPGPLAGVPVAIKDNLCVKGQKLTCASRILEGFVSPYDATVVQRLRAAGAIPLGKTNLDEFAMGSSTENSAYQKTRNPWGENHIPGGSSGGSAACVASHEAIMALGSDTGGSIRQPAALCGVVGLKPTYGRVSRYGLVAFASSLDQVGPITKDVEDAALLLGVIAGEDPRDSTSAARPVPDYHKALGRDLEGIKVGLPREYFVEGLDGEVRGRVEEAVRMLEKLGALPVEVSLPHTRYAVAVYYLVATAEASANLARYDGIRYGPRTQQAGTLLESYERTRGGLFGEEVKRRIMLGTYALSSGYYDAYYLRAQKVRTLIRRDFEEAFKEVEVLVTPTSPTAAFRFGEKTGDPLQMYLSDIYTISANLAGVPGLSLPCGFTTGGLPVGLQLMAPAFQEELLFQVGAAYEKATEWHKETARV